MEKISGKEKEQQEKIARQVWEKQKKQDEELKNTYPADVQELLQEIQKYRGDVLKTQIGASFMRYLQEADEERDSLSQKKPSSFFKNIMEKMKGWITEDLLEDFYLSVDSVTGWQVHDMVFRRSIRSKRYGSYIYKMFRIMDTYHDASFFGADIVRVYRGEVSPEIQAYMRSYKSFVDIPDVWIAAELDRGNHELEEILTDIICSDGNHNTVTYGMIRGIVMSRNERMYEQLGKLLIAARLQEGLRQAICECMDCGRVKAFQYLFQIITKNNLIRFSSVKRAVGTWTGLFSIEERDLVRISDKQLALIDRYLRSEKERRKGLEGEDSMEIYLALWSYAFHDIYAALDVLIPLIENGTKHQRMVACFFLNSVEIDHVKQAAARIVVEKFSDELDTMALVMPCFMPEMESRVREMEHEQTSREIADQSIENKRYYAEIETYFESREECLRTYDILKGLLDSLPNKKLVFSPCVFPWRQAVLTKSDIVMRLCYCASALRDNDKIDEAAALLPMLDDNGYVGTDEMLWLLLRKPETETQQNLLVAAIASPKTKTRNTAYKLVREISLNPDDYSQIEDMLRFKKADVRKNALKFLYALDGEDMRLLLERLLTDKKEEKRTAGLDLLLQLMRDENRQELFRECRPLLQKIKKPSTREVIMMEELTDSSGEQKTAENGYGIYDIHAAYVPEFDDEYFESCKKVFLECFPSSVLNKKGGNQKAKKELSEDAVRDMQILRKLDDLIENNKTLEYKSRYIDDVLLMNHLVSTKKEDDTEGIPLESMWEEFYEKEIGSYAQCFRLVMWLETGLIATFPSRKEFYEHYEGMIADLFGAHFPTQVEVNYPQQISVVLHHLEMHHREKEVLTQFAVVTADYLLHTETPLFCEVPVGITWGPLSEKKRGNRSVVRHEQLTDILSMLDDVEEMEVFSKAFPYHYALAKKLDFDFTMQEGELYARREYRSFYRRLEIPDVCTYIRAFCGGVISRDYLYKAIFTDVPLSYTLEKLSDIIQYIRDRKRQLAQRVKEHFWTVKSRKEVVAKLLGHDGEHELSEMDERILQTAEEVYETVSSLVMETEMKRGDSETIFSKEIFYLKRVYGIDYFVRILSALGKDTLSLAIWSGTVSKRDNLSHLLQVCIPEEQETAEQLSERLKGTDITETRLIEAALFSPEWLEIVGDYLGWDGFLSGCYYFMAHMNERYDDKRTAIIAKYTPLTVEELNNGAFDINWFREVYRTLGEKRFSMIYKSAKYISDGKKHARARKYADAAIGVYERDNLQKEIGAKRNKDLLMAYGLIPLEGDKDLMERYLYLQQFGKESKQFGAQRRNSEALALQYALRNLAFNAGYPDETRLTLKMESKITKELLPLFEPVEVEDVTVWLQMSETGKGEILCEKGGKRLKSVPARLKKQEYIVALNEHKNRLTEQYRRTRVMLEESMEEETEYTVEEIRDMLANPVVSPMVERLIFLAGEKLGFMTEQGLEDYTGALTKLEGEETVQVAHPYHLYQEGHWHEYQKLLFDRQIKQPFKQVFRELYVKTTEELESFHSLRYAGNQIQPKRTMGCLRQRRWVADIENGLQKVYYRENIVAVIYALADWFSPADIESPTLEWVVFSDRKTFQDIRIKDVPDILFSEVMRDVDLAVSVAHAGGVDPETSHSTIEMRRAIAEFTLPLFKLDNVTFTKSHAMITGTRGDYTVHLGSGIIHQQGGPMIQVLPVHSQHRGRLFLPFVDDDPKTAEVLSKILLFAEDQKIKDPFILKQIV